MMIFISQVDLATCSAYIGEECEYSGDRLEGGEYDPALATSTASQHVRQWPQPWSSSVPTTSTSTATPRSACSTQLSRQIAAWLEDRRLPLLLLTVHRQHCCLPICRYFYRVWQMSDGKIHKTILIL